MRKQELCEYVEETEEILRNNDIGSDNLLNQLQGLKEKIQDFKGKILFVGEFSAGKSALINALLGDEEILPENITPETAIATELQYGEDEKIIQISKKGNKIHSIDEAKNLSPIGFDKHIYVLNREILKKLSDFTVVDMPGFNSGIKAHNKALMQYIEEAAAYIFVIDINEGTVGQSSLEFLQEIKQYSSEARFVINKRDTVTPEKAVSVEEGIIKILDGYGYNKKLLVLSARDVDAGEKLSELLGSFSPDDLMAKKMCGETVVLLRQTADVLQAQFNAIDFNPFEIDEAIAAHQRKAESISNKLQNDKDSVYHQMQNEVSEKILKDAENALTSNLPSLAQNALKGNNPFMAEVNRILRPVLVSSSHKNIEDFFSQYVADLEMNDDKDTNDFTDFSSEATRAVSKAGETFKEVAKIAKKHKLKKIYQLATSSLAITTSFVAPWLELIIVFLPEIYSVLKKLFGKSPEEKMIENLKLKGIPQMLEHLRPNIEKAMGIAAEQQIEFLEKQFNDEIETEKNALISLKEEKEQKNIDTEQKKARLQGDINRIETIIECILAN